MFAAFCSMQNHGDYRWSYRCSWRSYQWSNSWIEYLESSGKWIVKTNVKTNVKTISEQDKARGWAYAFYFSS